MLRCHRTNYFLIILVPIQLLYNFVTATKFKLSLMIRRVVPFRWFCYIPTSLIISSNMVAPPICFVVTLSKHSSFKRTMHSLSHTFHKSRRTLGIQFNFAHRTLLRASTANVQYQHHLVTVPNASMAKSWRHQNGMQKSAHVGRSNERGSAKRLKHRHPYMNLWKPITCDATVHSRRSH